MCPFVPQAIANAVLMPLPCWQHCGRGRCHIDTPLLIFLIPGASYTHVMSVYFQVAVRSMYCSTSVAHTCIGKPEPGLARANTLCMSHQLQSTILCPAQSWHQVLPGNTIKPVSCTRTDYSGKTSPGHMQYNEKMLTITSAN